MIGLLLIVVVVGLVFGSFYVWSRRQGLASVGPAVAAQPREGRISLLTEAVAYVGAILVLAGGIAAVGQRWNDMSDWVQVAVVAGTAALFLVVGLVLRGVAQPAAQRLVDVVWFLSTPAAAGTAWLLMYQVYGRSAHAALLTTGLALAAYSAGLWLVRTHALQQVALFIGLVVTICGGVVTIWSDPSSLPFALSLWAFGIAWALLGWKRYVEPLWVSIPLGVVLALGAPSLAVGEFGWIYVIGVGSAAAAMGVSVPMRNVPLLGLGTVAMFGYVTAMVVTYFGDSLGVPAALAITGVVILVLATVSTRLVRMTKPGTKAALKPAPEPPGAGESHEHLPKAS